MGINELKDSIKDKILLEIIEFCMFNNLDSSEFINNNLRDSLMIAKYGETPPMFQSKENEKKMIEVEQPIITHIIEKEQNEVMDINYTIENSGNKKKKRELTAR